MLDTIFEKFDALVVLDTETSGLNFRYDEIIEVGAVRLDATGSEAAQSLSALVQLSPGRSLPSKITQLTGITPEALREQGEEKEAVCKRLAQMLTGGRVLLAAYNAQFDLNFLYFFLQRADCCQALQSCRFLDVLTVYRDRRPYPHKLKDAITAYGLDDCAVNSHRAIDDTWATVRLLEAMEAEQPDLLRYENLFGYHPKYGVSGQRIRSIRYRPQDYAMQAKLYEDPVGCGAL